jgi:hypothetical protein
MEENDAREKAVQFSPALTARAEEECNKKLGSSGTVKKRASLAVFSTAYSSVASIPFLRSSPKPATTPSTTVQSNILSSESVSSKSPLQIEITTSPSTALLAAALGNDLEHTKKLVEEFGAKVQEAKCPNTGKAALHFAVISRATTVIEYLLSEGAEINAKDIPPQSKLALYKSNERTPLHYAAALGFLDIAMVLVKHNADCFIKDGSRKRPETVAFESGL